MAQAIPIALTLASAGLQAGGTIIGANSQAKELRGEAAQLEQQAGQDRASSQRAAIEQKRQARLLQSAALARGAATGGGDDPTLVNILADIAGEGELRALTALYEGEEEARSKQLQAQARLREAKNVKRASRISAAGQILGAGATLYSRYGGSSRSTTGRST